MLNASVGVQRALARLRPTHTDRADAAVRFHRRTARAARSLRVRAVSLAATAQVVPSHAARAATLPVRRRLVGRVGPEAALPAAVALIIGLSSLVSWLPGVPARGATGGPDGDGPGPRIAIGGAAAAFDAGRSGPVDDARGGTDADAATAVDAAELEPLSAPPVDYARIDPDAAAAEREAAEARAAALTGPFMADGTLLKPIAVTTTVADGRDLLRSYTVRKGDTLVGVAKRFGVSMMTVWWANGFKAKTDFRAGRELVIPPVSGLVVTVKDGDTLASVAAANKIAPQTIYDTNELDDPVLVAGQVLVLPGAKGAPMPKPKPKPKVAAPVTSGPTRYTGGAMAWPVVGGNNYVSQYFHSGHYAIDIAADYGARVRAAAGGTVTFAGWKSNGGGYQVWISHGSGLYTTYNHMSAITVGRGQHVGKGQQVGRVGTSGWATGPHLHFEVWKGPIWNGGQRVNPMRYL